MLDRIVFSFYKARTTHAVWINTLPAPRQVLLAWGSGKLPSQSSSLASSLPPSCPPPPPPPPHLPQQAEPPRQGTAVGMCGTTRYISHRQQHNCIPYVTADWMYRAFIKLRESSARLWEIKYAQNKLCAFSFPEIKLLLENHLTRLGVELSSAV